MSDKRLLAVYVEHGFVYDRSNLEYPIGQVSWLGHGVATVAHMDNNILLVHDNLVEIRNRSTLTLLQVLEYPRVTCLTRGLSNDASILQLHQEDGKLLRIRAFRDHP